MQTRSIGDLAQSLTMQHRSARLRESIDTLSNELATGQTSDPFQRLGGDYTRLTNIDRTLRLIDGYVLAAAEARGFADASQLNIGRIHERVDDVKALYLNLSNTPLASAIGAIASESSNALDDIVGRLNAESAGRAMFAGSATGNAAVVPAQQILDAVQAVAVTATTAADARAAVDSWLADPAGFASQVYLGGANDLEAFQVSESDRIDVAIRADDPAIRAAIGTVALTTLAAQGRLALPGEEVSTLIQGSGTSLAGSIEQLVDVRAGIGGAQERFEQIQTRHQSERASLEFTRSALLEADPFETATKLERAQFQLESLYAVTVRMSQLNLVGFLR